jgi:hypothetical protein
VRSPVRASKAVDGELWWALRVDKRLAGTACPAADTNFRNLQTLYGLDAIVSLVADTTYDRSPLRQVSIPLEDLYGGSVPSDPRSELRRIAEAVGTVRGLLDQQRGVLVHCEGGTGRTGTVIGAVLVSYGAPLSGIVTWLNEVHQLRGKPGWPESPWQQETIGWFAADTGQSSLAPPGTSR